MSESNSSAFFDAYHARLNRRLRSWQLVLMAVIMAVGIILILSLDFIRSSRVDVQIGDPSPQRVVSPQTRTFTSQYLTDQAKLTAAASVDDVYTVIDRSIGRKQVVAAQEMFNYIAVVRADSTTNIAEKSSYLTAIETVEVTPALATLLLSMNNTSLSTVETQATRIIDQLMRTQIRPDQLGQVPQAVSAAISLVSEEQEEALMALVPQLIVPNSTFDNIATEDARNKARSSIEPMQQTVVKDIVILDEGEAVTVEKLEILQEMGLLQAEGNWWEVGSVILMSCLSVTLIFLYYLRYGERHYRRLRYMLLLLVLVLAFVLSAELLAGQQSILGYIYPAAGLAMLIAVIFDGRFAATIMLVLGGIIGFIANGSLEFAFYAIVGSLISIYTLRDAGRINAFFRAGLFAAIGNLIVIAIFNLSPTADLFYLLQIGGLAIVSGVLAAMVTIAGFFLIGPLFGITTMLQLQELSRFDQPLMKELLHTAPGTYHHSIMVANLAEQASDRIGANSLLARVGAFYHDIGKMPMAPYFSENQEGNNPHDTMSPYESAEILIGHVPKGLRLARKHRLPERLHDFIAEHHGTNVLKYFYKKACDQAGENMEEVELVDIEQFRYPGPIPRTRETGLVMMADTVEATSKAVQPNNAKAIEKLVRTITDDLLANNQLDECGLTLGDIKIIRESFVETLKGRYHVRVKYAGNEQLEAENTPSLEAEFVPTTNGSADSVRREIEAPISP